MICWCLAFRRQNLNHYAIKSKSSRGLSIMMWSDLFAGAPFYSSLKPRCKCFVDDWLSAVRIDWTKENCRLCLVLLSSFCHYFNQSQIWSTLVSRAHCWWYLVSSLHRVGSCRFRWSCFEMPLKVLSKRTGWTFQHSALSCVRSSVFWLMYFSEGQALITACQLLSRSK